MFWADQIFVQSHTFIIISVDLLTCLKTFLWIISAFNHSTVHVSASSFEYLVFNVVVILFSSSIPRLFITICHDKSIQYLQKWKFINFYLNFCKNLWLLSFLELLERQLLIVIANAVMERQLLVVIANAVMEKQLWFC